MTAVTGMCVTGPQDGKIVTIRDTHFRVHIRKSLNTGPVIYPGENAPVEIETFVYVYTRGVMFQDGERVNLFLPEGVTAKAAIQHIMHSYSIMKSGVIR